MDSLKNLKDSPYESKMVWLFFERTHRSIRINEALDTTIGVFKRRDNEKGLKMSIFDFKCLQ